MNSKLTMTEPLAWFYVHSEDALGIVTTMVDSTQFEGSGIDTRTGNIEAFVTFSSKKAMESFDKKLRKLRLGELLGFVF